MATQTKVVMNEKFQRSHTVDYFGKLILVSNHEDNFISANKEDIRYWIRKIPMIPKHHSNFDIEHDLLKEVPAFIYYIKNRKLTTKKESRAWFNTESLLTDALNNVREYSHTPLYFDLVEALTAWFAKNSQDKLLATPKLLLENILQRNSQYNTKYITKVLKDEFEIIPIFGRFTENSLNWDGLPGLYYTFLRSKFIISDDGNLQNQAFPF
jgi:hypothetical protein